MLHKSFSLDVKAVDDENGIIEFYGSTFGNIDRSGDIVLPGAFKDTLPSFLADGIIAWQHDWANPIGKPLEAREDAKGLWVKAQLLLEIESGMNAYKLIKAGIIKKFSIGYDIVESSWLDADNIGEYADANAEAGDIARALDWGRALKKLNLYEISPVSIPANPQCDLTAVKSGGLRAGLRFDEFSELVRVAGEELVEDAKQIAALRRKEGRTLSDANRARLKTVSEVLKNAGGEIDTLLEDCAPKAAPADVLAVKTRLARTRARMRATQSA